MSSQPPEGGAPPPPGGTAYPGAGVGGPPQGPPRHYHGIPFLPPDMNGMGQMQMPLVNGGPYPLYAPPNAGPPPMYNNHHHLEPPVTTAASPTTTTSTRGGKNGSGGKKGNGSNDNVSMNGHASIPAPANASPARQTTSNGGSGSSNSTSAGMPPDMYLTHGARPPPHGGEYDVLQGLAAIPVLTPGVSSSHCPRHSSRNKSGSGIECIFDNDVLWTILWSPPPSPPPLTNLCYHDGVSLRHSMASPMVCNPYRAHRGIPIQWLLR